MAYDPDQPRDNLGMWTSGGGSSPQHKEMMSLSESVKMSDLQKKVKANMDKAYDAGKKYANKGYSNLNDAIKRDPNIFDEVDGLSFNEMVAFESGIRGGDGNFEFVTAWRVGDIPEGGRSTNFTDQRLEPGLSVMETSNGLETQDKFSASFILAHSY
jgi:hypothetical protein